MRYVKTLWGIIAGLLLCVLVLLLLLLREAATVNDNRTQGEQPQPRERIVARIGDRTFTYEELQAQMQRKYGPEVLNQLLDRQAVQQEAATLGITVSEADIDKELTRMQSGYENAEKFYKTMKEQLGLTREDLREDTHYKLLGEKIAIRGIKVTDSEVDRYIVAHPEEFRSYTQFRLSKIVVATMEQAGQIIDDLAGGATFEALAKERSLDTDTATRGGDLGWVDSDDPSVSPVILSLANSLKAGEVSRPIQLDIGYAVLRLAEKKEIKRTVDAEARETLRRELALAKAAPIRDMIRSLREKFGAAILDPAFK